VELIKREDAAFIGINPEDIIAFGAFRHWENALHISTKEEFRCDIHV
jgi:hypothetical protein